jgi:hypothetical protein
MPDRLIGVDLKAECGWAKFERSTVDPNNGNVYYRFKCSLKPIFCHSRGNLFPVVLGEEYRIKYFDIISDKNGNLRALYLGKEQKHPHKDICSGYLCIGKFEGVPLDKHLIPLLLCCILKYDMDDCYCIPDSCTLENFEDKELGG